MSPRKEILIRNRNQTQSNQIKPMPATQFNFAIPTSLRHPPIDRVHSAICRFMRVLIKWWLEPELNRRHKDFQSSALPTELSSHPERVEFNWPYHSLARDISLSKIFRPMLAFAHLHHAMKKLVCSLLCLGFLSIAPDSTAGLA